MWKIVVGFVIFAALAMFVVIKGGDSLSLGGEQHGTEVHASPVAAHASAAPTTSPASEPAALAASAPASAASN